MYDSFNFDSETVDVRNNNYVVASFDVKFFFTNITVIEPCTIISDQLFSEVDSMYLGLEKNLSYVIC